MEELKFKKRASLGEKCFRRYEQDIGQATKGTFVVDPMALVPPMKASSYAVQIRDAMKSFTTEHWHSLVVPAMYEMSRIKVRVTEDDRVALVNEFEDRMKKKKSDDAPLTSIIVDENGNITRGFQKDHITPEKTFKYLWPEQRDNVFLVCMKYHNAVSDYPGTATVNLIYCQNSSEWKEVKGLEKKYDTLDIEEVGKGWFRINRW